jgi:uncharacterized C2H2 Zn-finger protein
MFMLTTNTYQKVHESCKFCGQPRDGKPMLMCANCRKVYNREKRQESRIRRASDNGIGGDLMAKAKKIVKKAAKGKVAKKK